MTCVLDVRRTTGQWYAFPLERLPVHVQATLESRLALPIDEAANRRLAHAIRKASTIIQGPGHQCLNWYKGNATVVPPINCPKTYRRGNYPILSRYPLDRWRQDGHPHLTELHWNQLTEPTLSAQFDSDEWLSATAEEDRDVLGEWGRWLMCEPVGEDDPFLGNDYTLLPTRG